MFYAYIVSAPEYVDGFDTYPFLSDCGYVFGFCPLDDNPASENRHDALIGPTICNIIRDFMERFEKVVLIYNCDSTDGRQRQRDITFNKWFNAHRGKKPAWRDRIQLDVRLPDGRARTEYLGYFADCSKEEMVTAGREFKQFAKEKVAAGKQLV